MIRPKTTVKGTTKFLFELKREDIEVACYGYEDCMSCDFMYRNGVCAIDMIDKSESNLKDLLQLLLKEIDYDHLQYVRAEVERKRNQTFSTSQDDTLCKE